MLKLVLLSLLGLLLIPVSGREEELAESVSPNKRYKIVAAQTGGKLHYLIKRVSDGKPVGQFLSEYQPEAGDENDWPFRQTVGAQVHWRKDSAFVAIDESNHRTIGTVIVARLRRSGFRSIPLDVETLKQQTKEKWNRGRLFCGAWRPRNTASLSLLGRVWDDPEGNSSKIAGYTFDVSLDSGSITNLKKHAENDD